MIAVVHPALARKTWPAVESWVAAALKNAGAPVSPLETLEAIEAGDICLYLVIRDGALVAAFTTSVIEQSKGKTLTWFTLGGEGMDDWLEEAERAVCQLGRANDCRFANFTGRRGWARVMPKFGWKECSVNMIKDLANG